MQLGFYKDLQMKNLSFNIDTMNKTHEKFMDLLQEIRRSEKTEFLPMFEEIIEHTKEHFAFEEALMREKNYYGLQEHLDEHANLLAEMEYFYERSNKLLSFGYSYIYGYAEEKFARHITNIDSQLSMFLKEN